MASKLIKHLASHIQKNRKALWDWHQSVASKSPPPFYCSIDLRDSGHKIVPVDNNLFPAGFNNICPEDLRAAPSVLRSHIQMLVDRLIDHQSDQKTISGSASANKILILPESHTKNTYYIENLYYLQQIIQNADFDCRIGWFGDLPEGQMERKPFTLTSHFGKEVTFYPFDIKDGVALVEGFTPDLIILNNDFSQGYPEILDTVKQPIFPSHLLGWHSRKKSTHFQYYNQLAAQFAEITHIDPWQIQIDTEEVAPVNFNLDQGIDKVAEAVDRVLTRTRAAYEKHHIDRPPFAFVKNNAGTYGMGIMVVKSAEEVLQMNRRSKNKMSVGKNRSAIESVVVQEGVPTATLVDRLTAEPVIYLIGCELIGGFLRTGAEKTDEDNLNSPGVVFRKLCMSDLRKPDEDPSDTDLKDEPILELVYGSIARLSAQATGMEIAFNKD